MKHLKKMIILNEHVPISVRMENIETLMIKNANLAHLLFKDAKNANMILRKTELNAFLASELKFHPLSRTTAQNVLKDNSKMIKEIVNSALMSSTTVEFVQSMKKNSHVMNVQEILGLLMMKSHVSVNSLSSLMLKISVTEMTHNANCVTQLLIIVTCARATLLILKHLLTQMNSLA